MRGMPCLKGAALNSPQGAKDLPSSCARPDVDGALRSTMTVGGLQAQIVAVRCAGSRSFGPLLYVATSTGGWRLLVRCKHRWHGHQRGENRQREPTNPTAHLHDLSCARWAENDRAFFPLCPE